MSNRLYQVLSFALAPQGLFHAFQSEVRLGLHSRAFWIQKRHSASHTAAIRQWIDDRCQDFLQILKLTRIFFRRRRSGVRTSLMDKNLCTIQNICTVQRQAGPKPTVQSHLRFARGSTCNEYCAEHCSCLETSCAITANSGHHWPASLCNSLIFFWF